MAEELDVLPFEEDRVANTDLLPAYDKEALAQARLTADFDSKPISEVCAKSTRAQKRQRKTLRTSTAGKGWFNLPATEINDDNRNDLELLRMRGTLNPKAQYRSNDMQSLPKYFQEGRIIDNPADFYSSRVPRAERRQTMVEELMDDYKVLAQNKKRYSQIKAREALTRKRSGRPYGKFSKRSAP